MPEFDYSSLLKRSGESSDKATFERWRNRQINIKECWKEFLENNNHDIQDKNLNTKFSEEKFTEWLEGMGYTRLKHKPRYTSLRPKGNDISKTTEDDTDQDAKERADFEQSSLKTMIFKYNEFDSNQKKRFRLKLINLKNHGMSYEAIGEMVGLSKTVARRLILEERDLAEKEGRVI